MDYNPYFCRRDGKIIMYLDRAMGDGKYERLLPDGTTLQAGLYSIDPPEAAWVLDQDAIDTLESLMAEKEE